MSARYMQPLRILIQFLFLLFMLWLALRFHQFVEHFRSGGVSPYFARPAGIDGFLPISGLLGLSAWFRGMGINPVHPAAVVLLLTVLGVSLLRRSFCSWICPVATISECAWKSGFRLYRRTWRLPRWLDLLLRGIKYLLLLFFVVSIMLMMDLPALQAFIFSDYHKIADVRLLDFFQHISPTALGILLGLLLVSLLLRNPFCRYLCPYGALLGLVATLSPLRVTRSTPRCVSCGVCSQVCPTYIDVMHASSVNSPECIGCWRCVSHCRAQGALSMKLAGRLAMPGVVFALLVVLIFWGGSLLGKATGHWHSSITVSEYRRLLGP